MRLVRRTFNFPNEAAGIVQAGFFLKGGGLIELIGPIDSSDKENGFVKLMEERPEGFKCEPNPTAASASPPSRPINTVSVKVSENCANCVKASGPASRDVARNSFRQGSLMWIAGLMANA